MAVSVAQVPDSELAYRTAGKPLLVGNNIMRRLTRAEWQRSADASYGTGAGTNRNSTVTPGALVADGHAGSMCTTTLTDTDWAFYVELIGNTEAADVLMIAGHNWKNCTGVDVQVADNSAFTVNVRTIKAFGATSATLTKRFLAISLDGGSGSPPDRLTNIEYFRIVVHHTGAFSPQIGEIFLGRSRQLIHQPNVPYDPDGVYSKTARYETDSGTIIKYPRFQNKRRWGASFNPSSTTYTPLEDFVRDIKGGALPFLMIPDPSLGSPVCYLMQSDRDDVAMEYQGPFERVIEVLAEEQGGSLVADEVA